MDQHVTDDEASGDRPPDGDGIYEITYRGLMRPRLAPDDLREAVHAGTA